MCLCMTCILAGIDSDGDGKNACSSAFLLRCWRCWPCLAFNGTVTVRSAHVIMLKSQIITAEPGHSHKCTKTWASSVWQVRQQLCCENNRQFNKFQFLGFALYVFVRARWAHLSVILLNIFGRFYLMKKKTPFRGHFEHLALIITIATFTFTFFVFPLFCSRKCFSACAGIVCKNQKRKKMEIRLNLLPLKAKFF